MSTALATVIDLDAHRAHRPADCIAPTALSGKREGYARHKCRCTACKAANTEFMAKYRRGKRQQAEMDRPASQKRSRATVAVDHDGTETLSYVELPCPRLGETVDSMCWCSRTVVHVPMEDVWSGLTVSCGRRGCDESKLTPAVIVESVLVRAHSRAAA